MYRINIILGLALMGAPFALGYNDNLAALWGSIILGAIIALASGYKTIAKDTAHWEEWVDVVAGIVAVVMPFIFGFSAVTVAVWALIVLGVLVVAVSGYELYTARTATR